MHKNFPPPRLCHTGARLQCDAAALAWSDILLLIERKPNSVWCEMCRTKPASSSSDAQLLHTANVLYYNISGMRIISAYSSLSHTEIEASHALQPSSCPAVPRLRAKARAGGFKSCCVTFWSWKTEKTCKAGDSKHVRRPCFPGISPLELQTAQLAFWPFPVRQKLFQYTNYREPIWVTDGFFYVVPRCDKPFPRQNRAT